jgi:ABC-type transport system involved in cytochrome c biogenesis permease subunit
MSVLWLRTATTLYSCGLLYALFYLFRKTTYLFRPALIAFAAGTLFHFVSIVELWSETGHTPLNNFYETSSACAFLLALAFLIAHTKYRISLFSVCIFPVVFFMTLIGATEFPVAKWSSPQLRSAWLVIHIATVLIGYAALIFAAISSVYYLLQERQLKRKRVQPSMNRLPPLGTIDQIITQSMNTGFVFITIATITGVVWAFVDTGTQWIGNPKIAFFLFTWAFYLAMIFLRISAGWRGRRLAWLAVSVLGCSLVTWATHLGLRSFWIK